MKITLKQYKIFHLPEQEDEAWEWLLGKELNDSLKLILAGIITKEEYLEVLK